MLSSAMLRPVWSAARRPRPVTTRLGLVLVMLALLAAKPGHPVTANPDVAAGISLGSLDGPDGYRMTGAAEGNQSGKSVQGAGDVNGDGLDDVIIGASNADPGGRESAGVAYLIYGRTDNPTGLALGSLTAAQGARLIGALTGDQAGESVSTAGDINGDGFGDLIIGAPGLDLGETEDTGGAYVVFGGSGLAASVNLAGLNGASGFRVLGTIEGQRLGTSVAGGGDVNGDGYDDIVIGAPDTTIGGKEGAGAAYVVFGASSFGAALDIDDLNGSNGFKIPGAAAFAYTGNAVAHAGDVNRDGYGDLMVAAWKAAKGSADEVGSVFLLYGKEAFAPSIAVSAIKGDAGFRMDGAAEGDHTGRSVAGRGDINGDGYSDMVIGAPHALDTAGAAYVVFGKPGFADVVSLGALNGSDGFRLTGSDANGQAGTAVANAADVNGDGLDDVLIGAPGAGIDSLRFAGEAYVVFGKTTFAPSLSLGSLGGGAGLQYDGVAGGNQAGQAAASAGDTNGDGYDDLLVGEPKAGTFDAGNLGYAYLIYGGATMGISLPTTHPGTPNDDALKGTAGADVMVAGRGADSLDGQAGSDVLKGGAGDDLLVGREGADRLRGGNGRDTVSYAGSTTGVAVDLFTGTATGGDAAGDVLHAIENLIGSGLDDALAGDSGANRITGGAGNDALAGGSGDDSFLYVPDSDQDTISDFVPGPGSHDRLDFSNYLAVTGLGALDITQLGADTRVGLPDGSAIILSGVQPSSLHGDDFRFGTAPVARDDSYTTPAGTTLQVAAPGVLRNDETSPGKPMTAIVVEQPKHGTLTLKPDGSFTFAPAPGYIGNDRFTYKANNGTDSNVARVSLTITLTPPTARDDKFNASSGRLLQVDAPGVLGNDISPGGTPLTAVLLTPPVYGVLTLNPDGSLSYLAEVENNVTDSFTYQAVSSLSSAEATVTIDVFKNAGPFDHQTLLPFTLRP